MYPDIYQEQRRNLRETNASLSLHKRDYTKFDYKKLNATKFCCPETKIEWKYQSNPNDINSIYPNSYQATLIMSPNLHKYPRIIHIKPFNLNHYKDKKSKGN